MGDERPNGWNEWSKYVLKELERLNDLYEKIDKKAEAIKDKLTMLHIKVAGIGVAASILTTIVILLLSNILGRKGP